MAEVDNSNNGSIGGACHHLRLCAKLALAK